MAITPSQLDAESNRAFRRRCCGAGSATPDTAQNFFPTSRRSSSCSREKISLRKLLHEHDVFTYNRIVPNFERVRSKQIAASHTTPIGGEKHGSQEKGKKSW